MCEDCQARFEKNPLRMIDCKEEKCGAIAASAPRLIDYLCDDCKAHFEGLKANLEALDIKYTIDSGIVRGLDYYTRTVFEFKSENVGSQGTICGGGRYDGLVSEIGGQPTPGIGFAMGAERFLLEMEAQGINIEKDQKVQLYIANLSPETQLEAQKLAFGLRKQGIGCEIDLMGRSFRAQMKYAGKTGIPFLLVLGDDEISSGKAKLKAMADGTEKEVALTELADAIRGWNK